MFPCKPCPLSHLSDISSSRPSQTSPNIALEAHAVRAGDWSGMTCMLFQRLSPERTHGQERHLTFKCNTTGFSSILHKVSSHQSRGPFLSSSYGAAACGLTVLCVCRTPLWRLPCSFLSPC